MNFGCVFVDLILEMERLVVKISTEMQEKKGFLLSIYVNLGLLISLTEDLFLQNFDKTHEK